jgi:hypothetical protein
MLTKLKHILNTYTDKELEEMELWVNSDFQIDKMIIDEYSIDLIQKNSVIEIKTYKNYDTIICKEDK